MRASMRLRVPAFRNWSLVQSYLEYRLYHSDDHRSAGYQSRLGRMAAVPRRLLNLFTALSPLLCVTVTALWVRSYWTSDRLDYQGERKLYSAVVHVGTLQLVHVDRDSTRVPVGFSHHASQVQPGETWSSTWNRPSTVR